MAMTLRAVDIASHQAGIDPAALDCDIVIIKATGGMSYVNPYWREWADATLASGRQLGIYSYAMEYGHFNEARDEARYFLDHVRDYIGRAVFILDFEADAQSLPVSWAREWLDYVASETGSTPMFYAYAAYLNSRDHSEVAGYPLWMASYLCRYDGAGWVDDPLNTWALSNWDRMTMYQYTSTGRIGGYDGNLDLSVFYGDRGDWERMQGGGQMLRLNEVAAAIHKRMVDDDRFGYSWEERYGASPETWDVLGKRVTINIGDYECGTSCKTAWALALQGTPYEGCLDDYVYSGNARSTFLGSGLFEWVPVDRAQVGDIYLNEKNHLAMCQGDGMLSEFCWGDNGAYGNQRGDQSGREAYCHGYYDYPWDGCLHYNGKADTIRRKRKDNEMQALYRPDGKDFMMWFDGSNLHKLDDGEEMRAVQEFYAKCFPGEEIPVFEFGTAEAPLAHRFEDAVAHGFPKQGHMPASA